MIEMARTLEDLIGYGEALAERFENDDDRSAFREPTTRSKLALAAMRRSFAERDLRRAVVEAKDEKLSWDEIGEILGVSGEAARKRYSKAVGEEREAAPSDAKREAFESTSTSLLGSFHRASPRLDDQERTRALRAAILASHLEAQGAETARFEEKLDHLLEDA